MPGSSAPLVSVCLPTFNSDGFLGVALESALAQTYEPLEILVVDNGSTDDTLDLARSYGDPRLRVSVNERNIGLVANHNQCVRLARGPLIKFLHSDDVLGPDSVERLVEVAVRSERIGLVFGRRSILLTRPDDPQGRAWAERYGALHEAFGHLEPVNPGRPLFDRWLAGVLRGRDAENWIGEPTSVLVRRAAFERVGLFNDRLSQLVDVEMWLRVLFHFDLGFVDAELSQYRRHEGSVSSSHERNGKSWLERLWLLEGLLEDRELAAAHPELRRARLAESGHALRRVAGRVAHRRPVAGTVAEYVSFLAGRRRPALHERLEDA